MHAHMHVWNAGKPEWPSGERGVGEQPSSRISCECLAAVVVPAHRDHCDTAAVDQVPDPIMHTPSVQRHACGWVCHHIVCRGAHACMHACRICRELARGFRMRAGCAREQVVHACGLCMRVCSVSALCIPACVLERTACANAVVVPATGTQSDTARRSSDSGSDHVNHAPTTPNKCRVFASQPPWLTWSPAVSSGIWSFSLDAQPCRHSGCCHTAWPASGC